jgi:hypothetical protein
VLYQATNSKPSGAHKTIDPKLLQEAFAYAQKVSMMDFEDDQQQSDAVNDRHHPLGCANSHSFSSSSSSSSSSLKDCGPSGSRSSTHGGGSAHRKQTAAKESDSKKKKVATKSSVYGGGAKPPAATKKKSERRIKEAMQWDTSNASASGDMSGDGTGAGASRKTMDPQIMQSLVSNFQNGTMLEELRKELVVSQQSMALSRQVLHEAAKSFFQPNNR